MNISENLLKRLADEAESIPNPASDEELVKLKEHNADGDTLEYFAKYNLECDIDMVTLDDAVNNLDCMGFATPDCEVWQHGFIPFGRDFGGRTYCFDQNDRDQEGCSKIVRLSYSFGEDTNPKEISKASEAIADNLNLFLELYLDSKVESM